MSTENSVITREHLPGLLLARTIWENGGPSLYFPPALQDATDQARAALPAPASVPDGYMPIPTAEQLADALDGVRCYHDLGAELIAPELLANLLAVTSVKAEQVPTPEFVWVRLLEALHGDNGGAFTASTDDYREAKPALVQLIAAGFFRDDADSLDGDIWAVAAGEQGEAAARFASCPDAYAVLSDVLNRVFDRPDEAPSLPAAGSADLTAVRCQCCATEYPHDSYDAGFIAGSGMCQVCDAAMPPKDLPAAGSAEEEVEVVAWRYRHSEQEKWQAGVERKSLWETEPLMTVAQHERLMAAEIQKRFDGNEQSSREHREELAQLAARYAGEVRVPELSAQEREDLLEFHEAVCCDAGHRVEKDGMRRLAEIGAVEPVGFGRHRLTEFGVYLLAQRERGGE